MKRWVAMVAVLVLALGVVHAFAAIEAGTKEEAVAMVKRAIDYIQANGPDKAYAEFSNQKGQFVDRDPYITIYDMNGKCLAHGANAKLIGKDLIDATDVDGKPYVKERVELAKKQAEFWQDYKFTNPVTKKVEPKAMYCERLDDAVVCGGVYK